MNQDSQLIDWVLRRAGRALQFDTVRFALVGSLGFAINFVALFILHGIARLAILPSQLLGAEIAILSNFYFHNSWTYRHTKRGHWASRLAHFHASAWVGSGISSLALLGLVTYGHVFYLIALALGALLGMVWNYCWTKFVIFRSATQTS